MTHEYKALPARALNEIDALTDNDVFAVWTTSQSQPQQITKYNVSQAIQDDLDLTNLSTQFVQPIAAQTIDLSSITDNIWLILSPTATLATLTLNLPTGHTDQQTINVNTTQEVTALSFGLDASSSIVGVNNPVTISQFSFFSLRYNVSGTLGTWYRIG